MLKLLTETLPISADPLFTTDKVQQSSVALIFRSPDIYDYSQSISMKNIYDQCKFKCRHEILGSIGYTVVDYNQRAYNDRDSDSGHIAFPGGKCEDGEDDFTAAVRETQEEIGLDLWDQKYRALYVGRLPTNMRMRIQKDNRWLMVAAHVFVISDPQYQTDRLHVQKNEVREYKWINMEYFANYRSNDVIHIQLTGHYRRAYLLELFREYPIMNEMVSQHKAICAVDMLELKMETKLHGLTLNFLQLALQLVSNHPDAVPDFMFPVITKEVIFVRIKFNNQSYKEAVLQQLCDDIVHQFLANSFNELARRSVQIHINQLQNLSRPKL